MPVGGSVVQVSGGQTNTPAPCSIQAMYVAGVKGLFGRARLRKREQTSGTMKRPASAGDVNVGGVVVQVSAGF